MEEEFKFKKIKLPKKKMIAPDSPILDHLQEMPASKAKSIKAAPAAEKSTTSSMTKKITTAVMVNQALDDLRSRKGCSIYAIKKYMEEKYNVNPDKFGYLIKKYLKTAIENGVIVQTTGIGASGSFKLDPKVKKEKKTDKKKLEKKMIEKKTDKNTKKKTSKENEKKVKSDKEKKKTPKEVKEKSDKKKTTKFSKDLKSPKKTTKRPQARRKSLGSIVKAPQMKPKTPKKPKVKKQKAV